MRILLISMLVCAISTQLLTTLCAQSTPAAPAGTPTKPAENTSPTPDPNRIEIKLPEGTFTGELPFDVPFVIYGNIPVRAFDESTIQSITLTITDRTGELKTLKVKKKEGENKIHKDKDNANKPDQNNEEESGKNEEKSGEKKPNTEQADTSNTYTDTWNNIGFKDKEKGTDFSFYVPALQPYRTYSFEFKFVTSLGATQKTEIKHQIFKILDNTSGWITSVQKNNDVNEEITAHLSRFLKNKFVDKPDCYNLSNPCDELTDESILELLESERLIDNIREYNENNVIDFNNKSNIFSNSILDHKTNFILKSDLITLLVTGNKDFDTVFEAIKTISETDRTNVSSGKSYLTSQNLSVEDIKGTFELLIADWEEVLRNYGKTKEQLQILRKAFDPFISQSSTLETAILKRLKNVANGKVKIDEQEQAFKDLFPGKSGDVEVKDILNSVKNVLSELSDNLDLLMLDLYNAKLEADEARLMLDSIVKSYNVIADRLTSVIRSVTSLSNHQSVQTDFKTRGKYYITTDLGMSYVCALKSFVPTAGINFSLAALNRNAKYNFTTLIKKTNNVFKAPLGRKLLQNSSIILGVSIYSVENVSARYKNTWSDNSAAPQNIALLTGVAFRVSDAVRISYGRLWMKDMGSNPLVSPRPLVGLGYVSVSLDLDWGPYLKWAGNRLIGGTEPFSLTN
jgi:hypothetical protein